jgi:hypothetical protein
MNSARAIDYSRTQAHTIRWHRRTSFPPGGYSEEYRRTFVPANPIEPTRLRQVSEMNGFPSRAATTKSGIHVVLGERSLRCVS